MDVEVWKDIPGFEGYYEASTLGYIRSKERLVKYKKDGVRIMKSHILKPKIMNKGYYEVILSKNNKQHSYRLHRLIATTFIPNPNNLPYINHIDENKLNNSVSNLEWCTPKYNNDAHYGKNKVIYQFDLKGNLISTHTVYENAGRSVGGNKHGVYRCCIGKLKTYKGFIWKVQERT